MRRCAGSKRDGTPCTASVEEGQTYCWWHDPSYSEKRRRAASRGGRAKARPPLTRELHRQLGTLADDVASGKLKPYVAAVCVQVVNARIRLVEVERRVQEQEELLERLEQLERSRGGGRPWAG